MDAGAARPAADRGGGRDLSTGPRRQHLLRRRDSERVRLGGDRAAGIDTLLPMGLERRLPLTAVREMIELTRALSRGQAVEFNGEMFQLHGARLDDARPDLEIWLAGRGSKMLALGGALADGVLLD